MGLAGGGLTNPIRPFWRYYGGKWRAVHRGMYPEPKHGTVIEPFAGGAGYAMHYPDRDVVLVERYHKVAAVWRWLIAATASDVLALPPVIDRDVREYGLPDGPTWLLGFWCNNAVTSPMRTPSKWMRSEKGAASGWRPDLRARIAADVSRIKHWTLIEGEYADAPDIAATWFIDPPYIGKAGSHYPFGSRLLDYDALGSWCRSRRGQVIACEGDGATWLPFGDAFKNHAAPVAGKTHNTEVVWLNEDAEQVPLW